MNPSVKKNNGAKPGLIVLRVSAIHEYTSMIFSWDFMARNYLNNAMQASDRKKNPIKLEDKKTLKTL